MIEGRVILLTGGTGTFGRCFARKALALNPHSIRIFSRGEDPQRQMSVEFNDERLRFCIGDVRDAERLKWAADGADYIVHAAALKQVPACESNPFEAGDTNMNGAKNVILAAKACGVKKVLALSTDKAVDPMNLYGGTKLVAEKYFMHANAYTGYRCKFSCTRYGNVIGSKGSVVPVWKAQSQGGSIDITDPDMTRFWITLERGVEFVLNCISQMAGSEIFVPKIPSMRLGDLARIVAPDAKWNITGLRPGEKVHEVLLSKNESHKALEYPTAYVIKEDFDNATTKGKPVPVGFEYASNSNSEWMSEDDMKELI